MLLLEIKSTANEGLIPLFFSKDSKLLFTRSYLRNTVPNGTVKVWDTDTGMFKDMFVAKDRDIYGAALSPCGKYVAFGISRNLLTTNDLSTKKKIREIYTEYNNPLAFSPCGCKILSSYGTRGVTIFTLDGKENPSHLDGIEFHHSVEKVAFSPNGRFAFALSPYRLGIWDIYKNQLMEELSTGTQYLESDFAVSPDSKFLIWTHHRGGDTSASSITYISVYDLKEQKADKWWALKTSTDGSIACFSAIKSLDISPDGVAVVAGGCFDTKELSKDEIYTWNIDAKSGRLDKEVSLKRITGLLKEHSAKQESIYPVFLSPDGNKLCSGCLRNNSIKIWNTDVVGYWKKDFKNCNTCNGAGRIKNCLTCGGKGYFEGANVCSSVGEMCSFPCDCRDREDIEMITCGSCGGTGIKIDR